MIGKFPRIERYDRQNPRTNRPENSCMENQLSGNERHWKADRGRTAVRNITWISYSFGYRIDAEGEELLFPSEDQIVTMIRCDPNSRNETQTVSYLLTVDGGREY